MVVLALVVEALLMAKLDVVPKRVAMVADRIDANEAVRLEAKELVLEAVVANKLVEVELVVVPFVANRFVVDRFVKKAETAVSIDENRDVVVA